MKNMKQNMVKKMMGAMMALALTAGMLAGCSGDNGDDTGDATEFQSENTQITEDSGTDLADTEMGAASTELVVHFGDDGEPFTLYLEDNETAQAIARHVGTSDWRLPVYDTDDDVDYSVMEYYDIPSRYEIPANPENVTEAKAGDVFYSNPNRIVLFYKDAQISEEYTKVGAFDATEEFVSAVEDNPILEGWGNKIVLISQP